MNTKTAGLLAIALIVIIGVGIFTFSDKGKKGSEQAPVTTPNSQTTLKVQPSYKDGVYTQEGDYTSPGGAEQIQVSLTLKGGIVTDAQVTPEATRPISLKMQGVFADNYKPMVIGKNINDLNLGKVSGSSLTPKGFNDAVEKIKVQAKSS